MSAAAEPLAEFSFEAEVVHWRGPSPYFFAPLPAQVAAEVRRLARAASYGWGVIPVDARIGEVDFTTSLFPRQETYYLPLKDVVRRKANVTAGDVVSAEMTVRLGRR
ncbi:MAG: DUF1905 domain-containing protein [Phenylobacterium sp.]|uniref:DUF1905 domain-containing protein n=1 Tax=Phenylobacterium sp. TaxID=1871053 RepID=UPI0012191F71|nr:DUF1905 domain-containing protein [Phenylobacterium sp.]TAJ73847.1 MAG: DUF1905 domain-containing protein [Phenylobacterium sp.]